MRGLSIVLAIVMCSAFWAGSARSQPTPARQQSAQLWAGAEKAWQELRFAEAMDLSKMAAAVDPSAPFAPAANARVRWLQQRAEAAFAALAAVERVRRSPALMANPAAIDELYAASAAFPPGLVRVEAWLLVADAASRLQNRPALAAEAWQRVLDEPSAAGPEKAVALGGLVGLRWAQGDRAAALAAVRRYGDVSPGTRARIERLVRRATAVRLAESVLLALAAAVGAAVIVIVRRRGWRALRQACPWYAPALGAYVAGGGAALAWAYEREGMLPFVVLGLGLTALLCGVRACRQAWSALPARLACALLGALGLLAVAVLALLTSPPMMEGFGL